MNLTNIKNGLGFIDRDILFNRMCRFTPPENEGWLFCRLPNRDFSELGIAFSYEEQGHIQDKYYKVFQIYTGNIELYSHICNLLEDIAKQFERTFEMDEWSDDDNK